MKIINEGKKISNVMEVTCKTCDAQLEIEANDLRIIPKDRPFDSDMYQYKCPCCSRVNYLAYCDLTEAIQFDPVNN